MTARDEALRVLAALEARERARLVRAGFPVRTPAATVERLAAARPQTEADRRAHRRAAASAAVLVTAQHLRHLLVLPDADAGLAALLGMQVGAGADGAAATLHGDFERRRKAGRQTARSKTSEVAERDGAIALLARRWRNSEELLEQFPRSPVPYIAARLGMERRTVERRLKVIRERDTR